MNSIFLTIGAHVDFHDGSRGKLHRVVLDEEAKRITHLVVGYGLLQRDEYVIPISTVEQATAEEIQVSILPRELGDYPKYQEFDFQEPIDEWEADMNEPQAILYPSYFASGLLVLHETERPVSHRRIVNGIPAGEAVIGPTTVVRNRNGVVGKVDHLRVDPESWAVTELAVHRGLIPQHLVVPLSEITDATPEELSIEGGNEDLLEATPP